ncbi:MAG: hypothetical protein AAGJ54_09730 [Planctomycetota bacterium]
MQWSSWRPFPDPRKLGTLAAPFGPGVYQLRRRSTKELVLFGIGRNCAARMCSLLPEPLGAAGRNNAAKRAYMKRHLADVEYRTLATKTLEYAKRVENELKAKHRDLIESGKKGYRFPT